MSDFHVTSTSVKIIPFQTTEKLAIESIVASSTHAAELIAADFAADEALWLRRFILEIGFVFSLPTNENASHEIACNIHYFGIPKFRPIEEQALNNSNYSKEHL